MYAEHCTHARHHEAQRSAVAASLIAIAGALLGVSTFDKALTPGDLPLLAMIIALGIFGVLFSGKQYERASMHMQRARAFRNAIDAELPGSPLKRIADEADVLHTSEFRVLARLRIHKFWMALHIFVALVGLSLAVLAVVSPMREAASTRAGADQLPTTGHDDGANRRSGSLAARGV
ncbi:hypothetical protein C8J46_10957 [Sphingomonas sp. PP-F2F-A104-K0414]|nr:hypothetical protein C8J46_10957 [Sphingomonas sp. PP-F2F-A104-K0414]